tara:strand:+ start:2277 stop:3248 length:972 start_codon:yes stop_codon:yes gene_type:complete
MDWDDYRRPRSVGELRILAEEKVKELVEEGLDPKPVTGIGRQGKIAKSFWGHSWCLHLEKHCDYENRLQRGRSYVRNGTVVDLDIRRGEVVALVMGSELYELSIGFEPLGHESWQAIQKDCRGKIGSLMELLQGKLSDEVMRRVTDPGKGLFPQVGEMRFNCNCPDWAGMCKHVAAALYGVGIRLDSEPELLFLLRGVDQQELVDPAGATEEVLAGARKGRRRTLAISSIRDVFGIEPEGLEALSELENLDEETTTGEKGPKEEGISGTELRLLREMIGINQKSFAQVLKIPVSTLVEWESVTDRYLDLNEEQLRLLTEIEEG